MSHRRIVFGFFALILSTAFTTDGAWAANLVVSPTGYDSNPCTAKAPCATISHAVSIAPPRSRITVLSGSYSEMVTVTSSVALIGHDATIDATGLDNGILVEGAGASGTHVQGFTVENAKYEGILVSNSSDISIDQNTITDNDQGASASELTGECKPQNQVPGDCGEGLHLQAVTDSQVMDNNVSDNVGGILVSDDTGPSHNNVISQNVIKNNAEDCGITMPSHNPQAMTDPSKGGVYHNTVVGNDSEDNGGAGIGMFASAPGTASYDNRVAYNTVKGNGEGGINIHSHAPNQNVSGNVIVNNTIAGNGTDPDSASNGPNGISLLSAVDPQSDTIAGNWFSNETYGIWRNGPFKLRGLHGNHFDSSVTYHFGP